MASGPITSWQMDGETMETVTDFILRGSKITADGDCSCGIKRHLLLERKAMTNLDSILKSRNIILLTKVHLVKAMIFPVVMYGCENWTIRRSNLSLLKEINSEYSLEGLMLKLQYFGHLMRRTDSLGKTLMLGKTKSRRRKG